MMTKPRQKYDREFKKKARLHLENFIVSYLLAGWIADMKKALKCGILKLQKLIYA